jgi:hypothetical protein
MLITHFTGLGGLACAIDVRISEDGGDLGRSRFERFASVHIEANSLEEHCRCNTAKLGVVPWNASIYNFTTVN